MKISVIIPARGNVPKGLLQSLENQTLQPDEIIEVIGSGLTRQRNFGIQEADGDIVVFIDDDIVFGKDYLSELTKPFLSSSEIIATTGNVQSPVYEFGFLNFLWYFYARFFLLTYREKGLYLSSGFPQNYSQILKHPVISEMLYGCGMAIRKEILDRIKFNETLEGLMYGEDDWFANDLKEKGYKVCYVPTAISYDTRSYPKGKQAWKIRCTILNLIARFNAHKKQFKIIAFFWAMFGFVIFKLLEAIVMLDGSIVLGLFDCFRKNSKYKPKNLGEIKIIRKYKIKNSSVIKEYEKSNVF